MIKKPNKCCDFGEFKCTVPMPLRSRLQGVDLCIADIVAALNAANIITAASCCGHKQIDGNVMLEDGRILTIKLFDEEKQDATGTQTDQSRAEEGDDVEGEKERGEGDTGKVSEE